MIPRLMMISLSMMTMMIFFSMMVMLNLHLMIMVVPSQGIHRLLHQVLSSPTLQLPRHFLTHDGFSDEFHDDFF
jgi:hypothetical protein